MTAALVLLPLPSDVTRRLAQLNCVGIHQQAHPYEIVKTSRLEAMVCTCLPKDALSLGLPHC
jgi:hypothetical protein